MPIIESKGAASSQGFGEFAKTGVANYIEDVFSTWLYTGTGSGTSQVITNGIDLSTKGGLVWVKCRGNAFDNALVDTIRGANQTLISNSTVVNQDYSGSGSINTFSTTGFTVGTNNLTNANAGAGGTFASWTFRKQPKFFDVVTYTGNGANRTIAHSLGSVPGCILIKKTNAAANWQVYHRSLANTEYLVLNLTNAKATGITRWNSTTPTATEFSLGVDTTVNANGDTYVAYIFAHDAGGFGLTGTDNVISCGSVTADASGNATVTLGYEPQWILYKNTSTSENWYLVDTMRGWSQSAFSFLFANSSSADTDYSGNYTFPTSTGIGFTNGALTPSNNYIYIAIRRGPMKVPTDGTKVFAPTVATVDTTAGTIVSSGSVIASDMTWLKDKSNAAAPFLEQMRLTGDGYLASGGGYANEILTTTSGYTTWDRMSGTKPYPWATGDSCITYAMKRAPSFMDVVCYTGSSVNKQQSHNLNAVPEMMFVKARSGANAQYWNIYHAALGNSKYLQLGENGSPGTDAAATNTSPWNANTPTSTVFYVGPTTISNYTPTNSNNYTYVAYLFASCPGVSKVGSYTGNGTTQTINCGFAGGARFVLIKRTDASGDWYVYDTARGMTTLTDPYLLLNNTAAESATLGSVTTVTTGFAVNASILAAINTNAASYIYLAIA
jgi:hypothetical protein